MYPRVVILRPNYLFLAILATLGNHTSPWYFDDLSIPQFILIPTVRYLNLDLISAERCIFAWNTDYYTGYQAIPLW